VRRERDVDAAREKMILAGGCFWGMQDLFRRRPGVVSTRVGYSGGDVPNATYRNHGTHAEAIEIVFDPEQTSYKKLLEFFFQIHDPTTLNRQGNDIGTSYRSAIFYLDDEQRRIAEETIADVEASGRWPGKSSPRSHPRARSGRQSPSTRTTSRTTRTATRATSFARIGFCPSGRGPRPASEPTASPAFGSSRPGPTAMRTQALAQL
jgi:peptide-methionine (S)-S-oxide reductase